MTFGNQIAADVAVGASGDFMVVWGNSVATIQGQRFQPDATPQGSQFQVDSHTISPLTQYPRISSTLDGDFLVTWSSGHFSEPGPDGNRYAVAAQLPQAREQIVESVRQIWSITERSPASNLAGC